MPWMQIFYFLEGKNGLTPHRMGITEVELVKEMIARYKALIIVAIFVIPLVLIIMGIVAPFLVWAKCRDLREFLLYSLWSLYHLASVYLIFSPIWATIIYFYISSYYVSLRAQLFNEKVDRILKGPFLVRKFTTKLEIKSTINDHAQICNNIIDCNAFFGKFYAMGLIVSLPGSLIALNLVLFTEMDEFSIFLYTFVMTFGWIIIFLGSYVMALVQHEMKKTHKKLCKLQWKFNNTPNEFKMKVN